MSVLVLEFRHLSHGGLVNEEVVVADRRIVPPDFLQLEGGRNSVYILLLVIRLFFYRIEVTNLRWFVESLNNCSDTVLVAGIFGVVSVDPTHTLDRLPLPAPKSHQILNFNYVHELNVVNVSVGLLLQENIRREITDLQRLQSRLVLTWLQLRLIAYLSRRRTVVTGYIRRMSTSTLDSLVLDELVEGYVFDIGNILLVQTEKTLVWLSWLALTKKFLLLLLQLLLINFLTLFCETVHALCIRPVLAFSLVSFLRLRLLDRIRTLQSLFLCRGLLLRLLLRLRWCTTRLCGGLRLTFLYFHLGVRVSWLFRIYSYNHPIFKHGNLIQDLAIHSQYLSGIFTIYLIGNRKCIDIQIHFLGNQLLQIPDRRF